MNIEAPTNATYPLGDEIGFVALIQHVGDDSGIVNSARVSLGKHSDALLKDTKDIFTKEQEETLEAAQDKDRKLIKYLLEHNHGTPLEHNSLTFLVKCPIFIARQWMRHRISSFNEISGRYVEVGEEFYTPTQFRKQSKSNRQASVNEYVDHGAAVTSPFKYYQSAMHHAFTNYQSLLEAGVCREQARAVLPLATYTQFYWTCNLRSFLHFIGLRLHEGAQWEIQQYAHAMLEEVKKIFPETIKIWEELKK